MQANPAIENIQAYTAQLQQTIPIKCRRTLRHRKQNNSHDIEGKIIPMPIESKIITVGGTTIYVVLGWP